MRKDVDASQAQPPGPGRRPAHARGWRALTPAERKALIPSDRLAAKIRDMDQKIAKTEGRLARLNAESTGRSRKLEARRKIVYATAVQAWIARHAGMAAFDWAAWESSVLDAELVRAEERALFGLAPRPAEGEG